MTIFHRKPARGYTAPSGMEDEKFDTSDLDEYVRELIQDGETHTQLRAWAERNRVLFDDAHQLWKAGALQAYDTTSGKRFELEPGVALTDALKAARVYSSVANSANVDPIAEARARNEQAMANAWKAGDPYDQQFQDQYGKPSAGGPPRRRRW